MIYLCAISNVSSGSCSEDCSFCTQSARFSADIETYRHKSVDEVVKEAQVARVNRAVGFCLVTAGKGMTDAKLEYICKIASAVKKVEPDFNLIACNGTASIEQLKELKKHGIKSYNHNLETSENYYRQICTTHLWQDRYQTCLNTKEAGLKLCSGGIFGMGESQKDREEFVSSLASLAPNTVAINFFHPNSALPILSNSLSVDEALDMIRYVKKELSSCKKIMIAGGREQMFGSRVGEIFEAGANTIVIGDYLTTSGDEPGKDLKLIESLGLKLAEKCDG